MIYTKEQLVDAYRNLPEAVKEIIASLDSVATIKEAGQKYHLHIDQLGELSDEIGLVMLGLTPAQGFVGNIQVRLRIDEAAAEQIGADVNQEIFLPIREALKGLGDRGEGIEARPELGTPPAEPVLPATAPETPLASLTPAAPADNTIFEQKLGHQFNLPRVEVAGTEKLGEVRPGGGGTAIPLRENDPYLEPLG